MLRKRLLTNRLLEREKQCFIKVLYRIDSEQYNGENIYSPLQYKKAENSQNSYNGQNVSYVVFLTPTSYFTDSGKLEQAL